MANIIVHLHLDAENKQVVAQVTDESGVVVADWGSIKLTLGKDPGTTPANPGHNMGEEIKLRETIGCDDAGDPQYCLVLRSPWYATPMTSNPEV